MKRTDDLLAGKRAELLGRISAAATAKDSDALAKLEAKLRAIDALEARLKPARPIWLAPAIVGTISLLIVATASLVRTRPAVLELDASVTQFELTIGAGDGEVELTSGGFDVTAFELAGAQGDLPAVGNIASMRLLPASRLELSAENGRCIRATAQSEAAAPALRLITFRQSGADAALEMPDDIPVGNGMELRFCLVDSARFRLAASPQALEISKLEASGPPEVRSSTIVAGAIRFNQTGGRRPLDRLDRLRFADIRDGSLIVSLERAFQLTFAGEVGRPLSLQAGRGRQLDLTPSLLDVAANSADIQSLFGILTGLAGMLWAASRYFSPSRSR